jgi:hypothetical protein
MKILAESAGDYMNFRCEHCAGDIVVSFLGYDPAVPMFQFACRECGIGGTYKMQFPLWKGLPQKAARDTSNGSSR